MTRMEPGDVRAIDSTTAEVPRSAAGAYVLPPQKPAAHRDTRYDELASSFAAAGAIAAVITWWT
jgi:hypothetical protein